MFRGMAVDSNWKKKIHNSLVNFSDERIEVYEDRSTDRTGAELTSWEYRAWATGSELFFCGRV